MTSQRKKSMILTMTVVLSLSVAILYLFIWAILSSSYRWIERQNMKQIVDGMTAGVEQRLSDMAIKEEDWSAWDDTCAFVRNENKAYIKSNLGDSSIGALRINAMIFINREGRIVYEVGHDIANDRAMPVPPELHEHLRPGSLLLDHPDKKTSHFGFINLKAGPMMILSNPILSSDSKGAIQGTMIWGRYFDDSEAKRLETTFHLPIVWRRFDDSSLDPDFDFARSRMTGHAATFIRPQDSDRINGYASLDDIYGKPAILLRASEPRVMFEEGRMTLRYLLILLLVFGAISVIMTLHLLSKEMKPLVRMAEIAEEIASGKIDQEIDHRSSDSIGHLADSFRSMIAYIKDISEIIDGLRRGDLDRKVTPRSDEDRLSHHLRNAQETLRSLVADTSTIMSAATSGDLRARGDAGRYEGAYREVILGVNATMDAVAAPLTEADEALEKMSRNDFTFRMTGEYSGEFDALAIKINRTQDRWLEIEEMLRQASDGDFGSLGKLRQNGPLSENDQLTPCILAMMESVNRISDEMEDLIRSASVGDLFVRGHADRFSGRYREVIERANRMLEAVESPILEANSILLKMSVNDYSQEMSESHRGTFGELSRSVNAVRDRLLHVQNTAVKVSEGDLSLYETFLSIGKRSENDHLMPAFIKMMGTIRRLIEESDVLAKAGAEGNLEVRGDADAFEGDYRRIVLGMNRTMEAVSTSMAEIVDTMEKVADRDLSARVNGSYQGDFEKMQLAFNQMVENLDGSLSEVSIGAKQVFRVAAQISEGSQALAQGASEQATSLADIALNCQEMTGMMRVNSEKAKSAKTLSESASGSAEQGRKSMERLKNSMTRIKTASEDTVKIVKTIDEIAFQTNLLALNAAVEAARAGDSGKGFAVVAEEVRNLAIRSAAAAKSTADMIEEAVRRSQDGTDANQAAAESLESIAEGTRRVSSVIAEIAAEDEMQYRRIEQVTAAANELDRLTQSNAANAEESASAAEELSSQSGELEGIAGGFILSESGNESHVGVLPMKRARTASFASARN